MRLSPRVIAAMRPRRWIPILLLATLLCVAGATFAAPGDTVHLQLSRPVVHLTGPWRFKTGDDPRWAAPGFDDSQWELLDLTPAPGAHDGDVGLPGYVPGWNLHGHAGYTGYAWYRARVSLEAPAGVPLALAGPTYVTSTYQLYVDGKLLGGQGVFGDATPTVHSVRPRVFALPLPASPGPRSYVIAFRVWMDPLDSSADAGGIQIAPSLGTAEAIGMLHQVQWWRTFNGYVVDAVEPLAFVLLAIMAWALLGRGDARAGRWLAVALVLLALLRVNQVTYAWTPLQSLRGYDLATGVVLKPLVLAAWILAWRDWFGASRPRWLPRAVGLLALAGIGLALVGRPWFPPQAAEGIKIGANAIVAAARLLFAVLYVGVVALGVRRQRGKPFAWLGALAAALVGTGLFATELNALGIPGIWFPFGVGVSRGQYAYAAFIVLMFALVLGRASNARVRGTRAAPAPS